MGVILPGVERHGIFPKFFSWIGTGWYFFLWEWDRRGLKIRVTLYFTILSKKKESSWRRVLGGAKEWLALVPIATKTEQFDAVSLTVCSSESWPGSFIAGTAPSFSIKWCSNPALNWPCLYNVHQQTHLKNSVAVPEKLIVSTVYVTLWKFLGTEILCYTSQSYFETLAMLSTRIQLFNSVNNSECTKQHCPPLKVSYQSSQS